MGLRGPAAVACVFFFKQKTAYEMAPRRRQFGVIAAKRDDAYIGRERSGQPVSVEARAAHERLCCECACCCAHSHRSMRAARWPKADVEYCGVVAHPSSGRYRVTNEGAHIG